MIRIQRPLRKPKSQRDFFDGEHYQILSGCSVGDKIVKIPSEDIEDGQKIHAKVMALTLFININELTNEQYEHEMNFFVRRNAERVSRMRFEDDKTGLRLPRISPQGARVCRLLGIDEDEIRITCDGSGKPLCDGCYISLQSFRRLCGLCGEQISNRS